MSKEIRNIHIAHAWVSILLFFALANLIKLIPFKAGTIAWLIVELSIYIGLVFHALSALYFPYFFYTKFYAYIDPQEEDMEDYLRSTHLSVYVFNIASVFLLQLSVSLAEIFSSLLPTKFLDATPTISQTMWISIGIAAYYYVWNFVIHFSVFSLWNDKVLSQYREWRRRKELN